MPTILVVDDRPLNRQFLTTLLAYGGYEVLEAGDGVEALASMRARRPDLVIADIYMPHMNGFELAQSIQADPDLAFVPVIFYTATYRVGDAMPMAKKVGVRTVLAKPSEPAVILKTVAKALGLDEARTPPPLPPAPLMESYAGAPGAAAGMGQKLSTYLQDIQELNLKMTQAIDRGLALVAEREKLAAAATELEASLATLQAVALRLSALVEVGLEMGAERQPQVLLDLFCRAAQDVISARYVGVGILDVTGEITQTFISRGFDADVRGGFSARNGALGKVLAQHRPVALSGLHGSVATTGLPPEHPPIESFLGVLIASPARVYGWFYLANRLGVPEFSKDDERIASTLAAQLALCYENATLYGTVRQQAEQLREARERLDHIVASSPAVTYVLNVEGAELVPAWVGANIETLLGYSIEQALDPSWWGENVHPEDMERVVAEIPRLMARGRVTQEYRFRHADGSWRWIHDEQAFVRDPKGVLGEVVGSWVDATEEKNLEAQFQQAQKMESIGRLAGGVAHDFNNLLGIITGYGSLLARELQGESKGSRYAAEILAAAERAAALTRQLLAFSRQEVTQPRVLDLNRVVAACERMLRRLIGENIEVDTSLARDLGPVRADPNQIEQILMNLVINARDAMPRGGRLTIETAPAELDAEYVHQYPPLEPGPYVMLAVSDTGHGMTPEIQARIFEPFFTTKGIGKGTGLGLGTVYGIVRQNGGHVWVYSEPGHGSTFKVYLPCVTEATVPLEAPLEGSEVPRGTETILLVEDDGALRRVTLELLQRLGYTVRAAADAVDALEVAAGLDQPLHLLMTDVVLTGMGGRELAEQLVATRPGTKVLYASGYTNDAVVSYGVKIGEMAFLQKPFTSEDLARKVREVLDKPEGRA